jgi:hypothetical protein
VDYTRFAKRVETICYGRGVDNVALTNATLKVFIDETWLDTHGCFRDGVTVFGIVVTFFIENVDFWLGHLCWIISCG